MLNQNDRLLIWRAILPEALLLLTAVAVFVVVLTAPFALAEDAPLSAEETQLWNAYLSGDLIRLHVLADSDSDEAQRMKLAVRDALLSAFGDRLRVAGADDGDAVYQLLQQCAGDMRETAKQCARQNGFEGEVTADVGTLLLPQKAYGRIILPEGEYRGLRVTLGSGEGQNWWCVLFPQLCLSAASDEPWQTADDENAAAEASVEIDMDRTLVWDCTRVLSQWPSFVD